MSELIKSFPSINLAEEHTIKALLVSSQEYAFSSLGRTLGVGHSPVHSILPHFNPGLAAGLTAEEMRETMGQT